MAISEETKHFYNKEIGMPRWGWMPHKLQVDFKQMHGAGSVTREELRQIGKQFSGFGDKPEDPHRQMLLKQLLPKAVELHDAGKHRDAVELLLKHSVSKQALVEFLEPKPAEPLFELEHAAFTDRGKKREQNEDAFRINHEINFYAIADGMGGHEGGKIAAVRAINTTENNFNPKKPESLVKAVHKAHEAILADNDRKMLELDALHEYFSQTYRSSKRSGTTLTALHISNDGNAHIAHVGDTRVYRLREDKLEQLTVDDNEAEAHFRKTGRRTEFGQNYLTQTIGHGGMDGRRTIEPQVIKTQTRKGDVFLLCSDGLNKHVPDSDIKTALKRYVANKATHNHTVRTLVDTANQNGGTDNITAIVVKVLKAKSAAAAASAA